MNAFGIFLCTLIAVLEPFAALAQEPAVAMDSWRAGFSGQLDREIARLNSHSSGDPVTLLRLDRNASGDPSGKAVSLASSVAGTTAALPAMIDNVLRQQGLPAPLISVVGVESGFNRMALSPKGAAGL